MGDPSGERPLWQPDSSCETDYPVHLNPESERFHPRGDLFFAADSVCGRLPGFGSIVECFGG